ncbi:LysM domain-containing protein, partial [Microdochium bolleyi]
LATVPLAHASPFPAVTAIARSLGVRDATPNLPHDDKTESSCSWWIDNDGSIPCQNIPSEWGISLDNWLYWNPSLTRDCGNFLSGRSYCVEAPVNAPPPTTTKPTTTKPTSTKTSAVPTGPTNGIETPIPTQIGMISNCDKFYFVQQGDNCAAIATKHGITQAQFVQWNPAVGNDCTGLWSDTYACVHTIGLQTTSTTKKPTTTTSSKPTNGIQTPIPTQTGMVANCDKFHLVESGQSCATIATKYGITQQQIVKWNPAVGSDCTGLWANTYACVHIVGLATTTTTTKKPTTTTTKPTSTGNGIATPTPQQPGMVKNCDKFHLVQSGQTCAKIAAANTITVAKLQEWNTGIGSDCTGLWANAYVCV